MKLIALATSDWHLNNYGILDRRFAVNDDFEFSLLQIATYLNNFIDVPLFLLGDIFDKDLVNGLAIDKVIKFDNYLNRKVKCYFVLGQHDPKSPAVLDKIKTKNVEFIYSDKNVIELEGINFFFLDYCKNIDDFYGIDDESYDVLCTHQVWEDFVPFVNTSWKLESIPDHYKLVISGDYHKFTSISVKNKELYSCGSIVFTDFSVCDHVRNIYAIYKDLKNNKIVIKHLPILTRVIKKYKLFEIGDLVSLEIDLEELEKYRKLLPQSLKKSIFYLHVENKLYSENENKFNSLFSSEDIVNINFFSKDTSVVDTQQSLDSIKTFEEALNTYCKNNNLDEKFAEYAKELWRTYNIEQILDAIVVDLRNNAKV